MTLLTTNKFTNYAIFITAAVVTALAIAAMIKLGDLLFGIFVLVSSLAWWAPLVWTPILTVLAVYIIRKAVPEAAGTGSPHALIPTDNNFDNRFANKFVSVKIALGKVFLTPLAFLSGLSLGNEGPAVQVGAGLMHSFRNRIYGIPNITAQSLVMIGNGIGLAVCFGSIIGGFAYCLERMSQTFSRTSKSCILLSMVIGSLIFATVLASAEHSLIFPAVALTWSWYSVVAVLVLGIAIGTMWAHALIYTMVTTSKIGLFKSHRPLTFAAICGLAVAVIGIATDGSVLGLSQHATQASLDVSTDHSLWFVPAKFVASVLTAWSGVSAGMFIPMINMGAGIGASVAQILIPSGAPLLAALGMTTFLAVVSRAPLCSALLIVDLVNNYALMLPLLVIAMVATEIAKRVGPDLWQTQVNMFLSRLPK